MEVKEKSKKRELIKTIAIVFLVILLILTFFSNTFMNYSLPEVATQVVTSGTINTKIRGSGTIAANESYEVVLDQTREVRSICVKVGDTVAQGDLLFVLGDMESDELQSAQEALRNAQIEYQRQILNFSKEYMTDDINVKNIREALEKAITQRDANAVTEAEISYAKGDVASAEAELRQVQLLLEELQAAQENSSEDGSKTIEDAKAKVEELNALVSELESNIKSQNDKIKELNDKIAADEEALSKVGTGSTLQTDRTIQDAKNALDRAQTAWEAAWAANLSYLRQLSGFTRLGNNPQKFASSEQVEIERQLSLLKQREEYAKEDYEWKLQQWKDDVDDNGNPLTSQPIAPDYIYDKVSAAYDAVLKAQDTVESAQETYDRALEDKAENANSTALERQTLQKQINDTKVELSAAQKELSNIQMELSVTRDQRQLADQALAAVQNTTNATTTEVKTQIRNCQATERELTATIETLKSVQAELETKKTAYDAALQEIETQQKALEEALSGTDIDKQLNDLNLQTMRLDIEQKQAQVAKLRENSVDTEIKSNVSGIVSAINVTAGKDNVAGQAMATIDVVDRGYTIKVSVTNEQAKQVKVGDTAEVVNTRWGSDINAVLEAITSDPSAPGQNKMLVFRLSGDVEAGSSITLSIGQRSTVSDTVVPKSALREDTNGKFVLVVTSKSTPLGNRYTATRVDVQVIAEDDNNAAVSGVAANDYVITTSSKPIDPGSLVRMVENP